jgi:hypothetical protein
MKAFGLSPISSRSLSAIQEHSFNYLDQPALPHATDRGRLHTGMITDNEARQISYTSPAVASYKMMV